MTVPLTEKGNQVEDQVSEDHEFNISDMAMNYGDLLLQSLRIRRKAEKRRKFYLDISSELNQLLL